MPSRYARRRRILAMQEKKELVMLLLLLLLLSLRERESLTALPSPITALFA